MMDDIDDIEKAPMLARRQPSPTEEEEEEEIHSTNWGYGGTFTRLKQNNRLLSKPLIIVYALLGFSFILVFTLWATDRAHRNTEDMSKNPPKILSPEAYLTGNRTRRFRGKSIHAQQLRLII
jgi:hypothetical protein